MTKRPKRWKPRFDSLITLLLIKNHRQAAAELGMHESTVSKLMAWPPFLREYRRRRANLLEHTDARLQAMADTLLQVMMSMLAYIKPHTITYSDSKGRERKKLMDADPRLASQAALELFKMARARSMEDMVLNRADEVEQMVRKRLKADLE